ncbi:hypothetical protein U3516DRAFT_869169, partial [Neocallimastix sp. 'constans']
INCKDRSKDIAVLPSNKNYTLTVKENLRNKDFKIIIMDMKSHTIEWAYEPIKRLTLLENKESVYMDKIIIANNFTTCDRLYSKTEKDKFVYISNDYGLQLIDKGYLTHVYQMSINEIAFTINKNVIINNVRNMKLEYDKKNEHPWLQLTSNGKLYGSFQLELLNNQHYLNITDPIYSLKFNNTGYIVINDDKYLHKEFYKSEDYYV